MWSNYFVPMDGPMKEFLPATVRIPIAKIMLRPRRQPPSGNRGDVPYADFFIVYFGLEMIPSLVSAGYLEPLDDYMKKAD